MKTYTYCILMFSFLFTYTNFRNGSNKHPFSGLNASEIITLNGYPQELHEIITEDGYILTMLRIPNTRKPCNAQKIKLPVLLIPGLLNTVSEYLNMGSNHSLAFLLSNEGYDVWLLNTRGTTYSRKHVSLDPDKDNEFWDFSFHEVGVYDLTKSIDYILEKTGYSEIHSIGFSQGTTSTFAALSEKPAYNKKLKTFSAMSPTIYIKNAPGFALRTLLFMGVKKIEKLVVLFGYYEIFQKKSYATKFLQYVCNDAQSMLFYFCYFQQVTTTGYSDKINESKFQVIYSNIPAGGSYKQITHYVAIGTYDIFTKYDYGEERNMVIYRQSIPPQYKLSEVTVPIFAYYAENDLCLSEKDAIKGIQSLPNCITSHRLENYTHLDFLYADDVVDKLYKPLLGNINKFN